MVMLHFFKRNTGLFLAGTTAAVFFSACAVHKNCGENTGNKKYYSKRYNKALHERDSLCNLTKTQKDELEKAREAYAGQEALLGNLRTQFDGLRSEFETMKAASGLEMSKLTSSINQLNTDLGQKQATLEQREARLKQLETILRRQDSLLNLLNTSVKNALLGFSADELTVNMRDGKVYVSLSDKLLFKSGDANVESKGKDALKKLAEVLNKNNDVSIAIEGHTDNVPIKTSLYKDNWDLSAARATNVVRLLTDEYKMDSRRLTASGKGEFSPVADNATTEGRARNRRTEIVLSPKLEELMKLISN
jgi:chemotaxis protein MotB